MTVGMNVLLLMLQMENGQTVFPELGVSVTVSEATGQCCVSYGLEAADAVSECC